MALYTCPRCEGKKYLKEFAGIAQGVCFKCAGTGTVTSRPRIKPVRPLTEYQAKLLARIETGDLSKASYHILAALRDFTFSPLPQCPTLRAIWHERGEGYFQTAQAERLATL